MAMDAALVAAYRKAKMANVPKDAMGEAMGKLEQSLYDSAEKLRASKYETRWVKNEKTGEWEKVEGLRKPSEPGVDRARSFRDW